MLPENQNAVIDGADGAFGNTVATPIRRIGRVVALIGPVLPLLLIGGLKFTRLEAGTHR